MKLIIFDFDGTIADTFEFVPEIVAKLAPEFGREVPTKKELELLRTKSAKEIVRQYKISIFELPKILFRAREEIASRLAVAKTFPDLPEAIKKLSANYEVAIISSNSEANIRRFLNANKILINQVYTENSLFGKAKVFKAVMNKNKLSKDEIIYVGDEVRDVEAAKKAGVKIISVTWGYNKKSVLEKVNNLLANKPAEIIDLIKKLSN